MERALGREERREDRAVLRVLELLEPRGRAALLGVRLSLVMVLTQAVVTARCGAPSAVTWIAKERLLQSEERTVRRSLKRATPPSITALGGPPAEASKGGSLGRGRLEDGRAVLIDGSRDEGRAVAMEERLGRLRVLARDVQLKVLERRGDELTLALRGTVDAVDLMEGDHERLALLAGVVRVKE